MFTCPFTKQPIIKRICDWIKFESRERSLSREDVKFLLLRENFGSVVEKSEFSELYINQKFSMPDFHREFGLSFEYTQFLIKFHGLVKRSIKEAADTEQRKGKFHKTCLERYGVDNVSVLPHVKEKKIDTFNKNYGVDNIFKDEKFKKGLNDIFITKYGVGKGEFHSKNLKKTWNNKTAEERNQWIEVGIGSEKAQIRQSKSVSKAENKISDLLNELKIEHVRQFKIKNGKYSKQYDFLFPSVKLILEFHGSYWHADPTIYKSNDVIEFRFGKVSAQEIWDKDKEKMALAVSKGYRMIVIWESETKHKSKNQIIKLIKEKINSILTPS